MKLLSSIELVSITICALAVSRRAVSAFCPTAAQGATRRQMNILTRRYQSSSSSSSSQEEQDLQKWERMYYDGTSESSVLDDGTAIEYYAAASAVRVVTFDLDNCLWKTGATISAANDALAEFLTEREINQPVRVEKIMGQLFKTSPETYSPNGGKAPVLLTRLRKDAIQQVLQEDNDYSTQDAIDLAEEAFQVWTKARHDAIPANFASAVVDSIQRIRDMPTPSGHPILIGAVTDGNSDPRNVQELSDLFDFCVNAESVGVSKPNKQMYFEAMNVVSTHEYVQDIFGPISQSTLSEEAIEDIMGPWWVHVGDEFIKDVVPAKELKMRSVWARELILDKMNGKTDASAVQKPKKTVEEFVKEVSSKKVIEMAVGADDYLVDSIRSEFADAVVDSFAEISNVLSEWQESAMRLAGTTEQTNGEEAEPEMEMVAVVEVASATKPTEESEPPSSKVEAKKFCMYCGIKLPVTAKFCSSCGEKQPELT